MNRNIYSLLAISLFSIVAMCSCTALDEAPDNRTDIDTADKVSKLLTSAYPWSSPALLCELSSDDLLDNNVVVPATHRSPYAIFHEQAYKWEDIDNYSTGENDTPYAVWEAYYQGIAVANHAIDAMRQMSEDPANDPELAHSWGEAHVLRGYLHFVLVNVFAEAYKDETRSLSDNGIAYVREVENTVNVNYGDPKYRKSVAEVYDLIERDILEGIDLIDDSKYQVPAYHFNRNATNAFAARFYLFKRDYEKALKYANNALGANPQLRNWGAINKNTTQAKANDYNDERLSCNYLLQSTYSWHCRMHSLGGRFVINEGGKFTDWNDKEWQVPSTFSILFQGGGPNWSGWAEAFKSMLYISGGDQEYGVWLLPLLEYFETTDKFARIGIVHQLYHPFTADETILCRAEAKLYLGDRDGAIKDLELWTSSHMVKDPLTLDKIKTKYNRAKNNNIFVSELYPAEMGFEKVLTGDDLSVLDCILHFRRIETVHEGQRWFDIKRYGIKVIHHYRSANEDEIHTDSLTWNDPRRVLQIPQDVINAGYPSTDRTRPVKLQYGSSIKVPGVYQPKGNNKK